MCFCWESYGPRCMQAAGADVSALAYVRRMRRMKLTGRAAGAGAADGAGAPASSSALAGLAGQSHLLNWADKTFGQGLSSLTKGVQPYAIVKLQSSHCAKCQCLYFQRGPLCCHLAVSMKAPVCRSLQGCCACRVSPARAICDSGAMLAGAGVKVLLAGEQQAAVTVAVEGLMDGKPLPDLDSFLTFDPKVRFRQQRQHTLALACMQAVSQSRKEDQICLNMPGVGYQNLQEMTECGNQQSVCCKIAAKKSQRNHSY